MEKEEKREKRELRLHVDEHYDDVERGTLTLSDGQGRRRTYRAVWQSDLRTASVRQLPRGVRLPLKTVTSPWSYETPQARVGAGCRMSLEPLLSEGWHDFGMQLYVETGLADYRRLTAVIAELGITGLTVDEGVGRDLTGTNFFREDAGHDSFWE